VFYVHSGNTQTHDKGDISMSGSSGIDVGALIGNNDAITQDGVAISEDAGKDGVLENAANDFAALGMNAGKMG
jgi:hypothetical protein